MENGPKISYYLFNAFLDTRKMNPSCPEVRILLMADVREELQEICGKSYCQIWFRNESQPLIVPVSKIISRKNWFKNITFHSSIGS